MVGQGDRRREEGFKRRLFDRLARRALEAGIEIVVEKRPKSISSKGSVSGLGDSSAAGAAEARRRLLRREFGAGFGLERLTA